MEVYVFMAVIYALLLTPALVIAKWGQDCPAPTPGCAYPECECFDNIECTKDTLSDWMKSEYRY